MLSFEEAGRVLDEAVEALPEGIFRELNGGVNLLPDTKKSDDGRFTLGLYHNDLMGRRVEIFYGSFLALYGELPDSEFREHLVATLHHELTHHIEGLAGDRTLEHWDEEQTALWEQSGAPLRADSVLFVDADDCALAPAAAALFAAAARDARMEMRCASAGLEAGAALLPEAVKAAANAGVDISGHAPQPVTQELLERFDAILCMTLSQADALALRFPEADERILCLGERDIRPPKLRTGWGALMRRLRSEAEALIDELCAEDAP